VDDLENCLGAPQMAGKIPSLSSKNLVRFCQSLISLWDLGKSLKKFTLFKLQFIHRGEDDDVMILDAGVGPSLLVALAELDRQICLNCGPHFSLWKDTAFDLNEFKSVMTSVNACYSRRDPEDSDDDFDIILEEM
jgi:hypothetical protein